MQPLYDGSCDRDRINAVVGMSAMASNPFHTDQKPIHRRSHIAFANADHAFRIRRICVKSPDALHIFHYIRFQYLHGAAGILFPGLKDKFHRSAQPFPVRL